MSEPISDHDYELYDDYLEVTEICRSGRLTEGNYAHILGVMTTFTARENELLLADRQALLSSDTTSWSDRIEEAVSIVDTIEDPENVTDLNLRLLIEIKKLKLAANERVVQARTNLLMSQLADTND
jgi:hypothetical protein